MRVIEGGVTAAKGYKAAGLRAGIKAGKTNKDMAMIYSEKEAVCAGTFTKNVVKAAPVFWDRDVVYKEGKAQAVVVNSGIANACTGEEGLANCKKEAQKAGELLNVAPEHVLVASTGVIGAQLVMDVGDTPLGRAIYFINKPAFVSFHYPTTQANRIPLLIFIEFPIHNTHHSLRMFSNAQIVCDHNDRISHIT